MDIKQIFHGFTETRKIMNTVADIGNRLNMLSEGTRLTPSKHIDKLTTLSNSVTSQHILYTVHTVHVPCFPVSDVEVSSSTSVHHTCSLVLFYISSLFSSL